jgi:hypothetical protein
MSRSTLRGDLADLCDDNGRTEDRKAGSASQK